ncbi:hypothetical protein RJ639_010348 [Escallonia herrerae]|uniref:F-box domain-containing protein n=1 Tax=Escallonia herrerae TaxID=1293975 RepID=A0AA88VRQ5_9ASTE|nr:hypothetical protein RJ639_010348 [Escallonia herrerae]
MSDYLPDEIIEEILTKLPVKSLLRFTAVCKSWYSHIKNPSFINAHLNQTIANTNTKAKGLLLGTTIRPPRKSSTRCTGTTAISTISFRRLIFRSRVYLGIFELLVRHLELKREKEVERENLVKFLSEAMETQFRNPSIDFVVGREIGCAATLTVVVETMKCWMGRRMCSYPDYPKCIDTGAVVSTLIVIAVASVRVLRLFIGTGVAVVVRAVLRREAETNSSYHALLKRC